MIKIFKQLGRHWAACLAVVALLVVQAYCDLSLPDYTSKIVDVGIQQGGIESPVPDTVRDTTLQALELLKWLESRPDSDRYPQCMRTVLLLCADGLEQLGRFWERRDAEDYRARAEALNASDQVITDEDELYEPESLPEELAVQIGCIERLESAIAQGQEEAALRLYRSYRKWFSDRIHDCDFIQSFITTI